MFSDMADPLHDVAHIAHVELLSPKPQESLDFFHDVLGMEIEATQGASVFLRGWGDYHRTSLKLTEAPEPGMGHMGLRTWSPEALDRRVAALEAAGVPGAWVDGDVGHGPGYRFHAPDGHVLELYWESERYVPPEHLRPALRNQPQRYTARGCAVKRLDHVNLFSQDVVADREFMADLLGFRLYERNVRDDGTETGAWMSLTIAGHELIYTVDPSPLSGRLHHAAFWVDTREEVLRAADVFLDAGVEIEAAPSKHAAAQGFFLYGLEPGGNRVEVTSGGYFVYDPEFEPVVRPEAELLKGMSWGVQLPESFRTYGTPVA
jgi:catechol 2,3-dioxygenase